jgi:hypothetical protein
MFLQKCEVDLVVVVSAKIQLVDCVVAEVFIKYYRMPNARSIQDTPERIGRKSLAKKENILNPPTSLLFWFSQSLPIAEVLSGVIRTTRPEEVKINLWSFVRTEAGMAARAIQYTACPSRTTLIRVKPTSKGEPPHAPVTNSFFHFGK